MTVKAFTPALKVTLLKHLVAGKDLDFCATVAGLPREHVLDIVAAHGYPDVDKMAWAVDVLTTDGNKVPESTLRAGTPIDVPVVPRPAFRPASTPPPVIDDIFAQAAKSPFARTRTLGAKVAQLLDDLEERIQDEREAVAAKVKADKDRAAVASRIAVLEAEIAKLKGKPAKAARAIKSSPLAGAQPDSKLIRAWAATNGVTCTSVGRVPQVVRDAYTAAANAA